MKKLLILFLLLIFTTIYACTFSATIHDERKAANNTKSILDRILFHADARSVYDATADVLKDSIKFSDFQFFIDQLSYSYPHTNVQIYGYKLYGTEEILTVYATSDVYSSKFYYALTYSGTKSKGYYLNNFKVDQKEISKNGNYQKYSIPIEIDKSKRLDRNIKLSNGSLVSIEAITKTLVKKEHIYVYTLKYYTEINIDNHEVIRKLAKQVLDTFGAKKAKDSGLIFAAMVAANGSRLKYPIKNISVYRTIFELVGDKWVYK